MKNSSTPEIHRIDIPSNIDLSLVIKRLQFQGGKIDRLEEMATELAEQARAVARPVAIFTESPVRPLDRDSVEIGGTRFRSRILSRKLEGQETAYPFVGTIGKELDELQVPQRDIWREFCLDAIKTVVLISSAEYTTEQIKKYYSLGDVALLNPGELDDFPLAQQEPLFALFGQAAADIGVSIGKGGAMRPLKSRSGIIFPDNSGFVSCQLCKQKQCPGRRSAFSPQLEKEYLS